MLPLCRSTPTLNGYNCFGRTAWKRGPFASLSVQPHLPQPTATGTLLVKISSYKDDIAVVRFALNWDGFESLSLEQEQLGRACVFLH